MLNQYKKVLCKFVVILLSLILLANDTYFIPFPKIPIDHIIQIYIIDLTFKTSLTVLKVSCSEKLRSFLTTSYHTLRLIKLY